MRRKSKPRVVWLPCTNVNSLDEGFGPNTTTQLVTATIFTGGPGSSTTLEMPVVQDGNQSDPLDPVASLSDIENSGYRLRRIVGKVYCFIAQTGAPTASLFAVTAGFIIRRTAENANTGANTGFSQANSLNPQSIDANRIGNSMDPWIWRRTWLLANNGAGGTGFGDAPGQNFGAQYPGPLEGPHVDQKTARIVGQEERLFLDVSVMDTLGTDVQTSIVVITDLRVLASMRTSVGNRRNASR